MLAAPGERRRRRCSTATTPGCGSSAAHTRATVLSFGREPVEFGTFLDGDDAVDLRLRAGAAASRSATSLARSPLRGAPQPREHAGGGHRGAPPGASPPTPSSAAMRHHRGPAASPRAGARARRRALVRRLEGDQRRRGGEVDRQLPGGVVLLAGGYDKGGDFAALRAAPARRASRTSICFGKAGPDDRRAARRRASPPCVVPDLAAAVACRRGRCARPGEVGAAGARLRQLRRVPRLRGARRSASARWWRRCDDRLRPLSRLRQRVVMPRLTRPDVWLLAAVAGLLGLGIVMVLQRQLLPGQERYGDPYLFFRKHLVSVAVGVVRRCCWCRASASSCSSAGRRCMLPLCMRGAAAGADARHRRRARRRAPLDRARRLQPAAVGVRQARRRALPGALDQPQPRAHGAASSTASSRRWPASASAAR